MPPEWRSELSWCCHVLNAKTPTPSPLALLPWLADARFFCCLSCANILSVQGGRSHGGESVGEVIAMFLRRILRSRRHRGDEDLVDSLDHALVTALYRLPRRLLLSIRDIVRMHWVCAARQAYPPDSIVYSALVSGWRTPLYAQSSGAPTKL